MSTSLTTKTRSLLFFLILFSNQLFFAQTASGDLGVPCATCSSSPKFTPSIIMDGNQANVTSYTASACGLNYVYGSVKLGKRWASPGVTQPAGITISGLPTGCNTILKAFLYADASGNGIAVTSTVVNPASVSTSFPMSIIGVGPDKCWSYSGSYSYRADITTAITGNGTYMVSGLPTNPPVTGNDVDGATILIIYADPTQTYTGHMTIADGADVAAPSVSVTNNITIPAACANSIYADGIMIIGDLQGIANSPMRFNSAASNYTFPAASNLTWNVVQAAANPVTVGQTSAIFGATNSGDCYNIVASCLYYRTTCNTCTFTPPGSMSITATSSSSCTTGTATANPTGGTGPYTYSWSPGSATTQTISGAPGIYTVTVKDAACSAITTTVAITALPSVSINVTTTQPSCLNPPGTSTAVVGGGNTVSGFTVSWSPTPGTITPTSNGSVASGLTVGTMTATVIDASGCSANTTFTVSSPAIASFSVDTAGFGTLTCLNPSVILNAINTSTLTNITYTWMPGNVTGNTYSATSVGVYTVIGQDLTAGSCPVTQTIAISQNTAVPIMTVTPVGTQSLACSQPCKTFTAIASSTTNIFGTWYDVSSNPPVPLVGPSGGTIVLCAGTPGTYAITFTNVINGCTSTQTVGVTSNTSVPTITVTSVLGGFQLNCTKPCLPLNINSNVAIGPTSYTWTNLSTNVSTYPANGGFTVCTTGANVPGQYVASVKDGLGCTVSTTITISIDTLKPAPTSTATLPSLAPNSYTINCFTPSIVATGISTPMYPANNYSWTIPGTPNLIISTQTINVSMVNIPSSTSPTNYTVLAMNPNNGCVGRRLVKFYKDVFVPPYTVVFTPSAITCADSCVAFSPKNSVTSNTMPVTYTFTSPPPTQTATTLGALMCVPGPYTMTYMNAMNGCTAAATTTVQLNTTPPATFALTTATINCGAVTTTLIAGHTGSASASTYSYNWSGPPLAGMSCPGGPTCYSTTANAPGLYQVTILNTVNGCVATNSVFVVPGNLNVSFTPDPITGFAPLDVNFGNTTILGSSTNGTVTTTWNYGNGISQTYTGTSSSYSVNGPPNGSTTYQSAGSYTVLLVMSQLTGLPPGPGMPPTACIGTATAVVEVELPSEMIIPNVFTPNADGVNDVFFLHSTSMTEITCTIFDRWGVKMYDVLSDKGNISWDGKNLFNKDVPDGTYFYIIKGKGKDLKQYEFKGTVSLYR